MFQVKYKISSKIDIREIFNYIKIDNPYYAEKVIHTLITFINNNLSIFPNLWKDKWLGLREIIEPTFKYRIIYKIKWNDVFIVSIFKNKNLY